MSRKAICGGMLLDGTGKDPLPDSIVLINGNRIEAVGSAKNIMLPKDSNLPKIDASGMTVMPGMIDGHVHLYMNGESEGFFEIPIHNNSIDIALQAIPYLRDTIEMGFTTIRDGGSGHGWFEVSLRDAIDRGIILGPRLLTSGYHLTVTGGHGYFLPHWLGKFAPAEQVGMHCDGPEGWRKGARTNLYNGTDNIKVVASRGFASLAMRGSGPPTCAQATVAEMRAAIEEAHKMGKKTIAHANGPEAVINAVKAGVDTIVHGLHMGEEAADLMVSNGTVLEPTNICYRPREKGQELPTQRLRPEAEFRMFLEKGITISMGTDASVPGFHHGENGKELVMAVELGMSPMAAILSATRTAAETLGLEEQIGILEPEKLADLLLVAGDPLADIAILSRKEDIRLVMKDGQTIVRR